MNYFAGFNYYVIQEHNERLRREMSALRPEKRLRENRKPRSSRRLPSIRKWIPRLRHA